MHLVGWGLLLALVSGPPASAGGAGAAAARWEPVSLDDFRDSIHHARVRYDGEVPPYPVHPPDRIAAIADTLLAHQHADGGWPKNVDWQRAWSPDALAKARERYGGRPGGTLDNRTTWAQVRYLCRVHRQTRMARHAEGARRGIAWILARQHPVSGGWRGSDIDAVTFNDDVMAGVMTLLRDVVEGEPEYGCFDAALRARCRTAWNRGLACILRCQVRQGRDLAVWGQQHDHTTLRPVKARSFELASLTAGESVDVVRLLMSIDAPSAAVKASVRGAVRWLHERRIACVRVATVREERTAFRYHVSDTDRVVVADPDAPAIWTRFYDMENGRPVFFTRSSRTVTEYEELSRERRTGYGWWTRGPAALLTRDYPRWRARHDPAHDVLADGAPPLAYEGRTVPPEQVADREAR